MSWFDENRRPFPWRENKNPYSVWLSEIILQQTRAQQGLPYFQKFISTYPDVQALANAPEDHVMKLWQGLGYYSRARNLHATAKIISEHYGGKFPDDFHQIKRLKGIGDYTASAIASICFGEEQAVVDGNVYRVLSRIFGMHHPIDTSKAHQYFKAKAQSLMKGASPGEFNQAMMEFGALQCVPKNPDCEGCPFKNECLAYKRGKVDLLPIKAKKVKIKNRYFHFFVLVDRANNTLLEKRHGKGIWQNLYQFPLIETFKNQKKFTQKELKSLLDQFDIKSDYQLKKWNKQAILHKLTHQHLEINFWIVKLSSSENLSITMNQISDFPMPKALQNFRDNFFSN